jgi:hypothetical protein
MKTKSFLMMAGIMAAVAVSFTACEKEDEKSPEVLYAEEDAISALLFEDIYAEVEEAMEFMENQIYATGLKSASATTCRTITVEQPNDSTYWPRTVTVDYGEGCTGPNGRVRKGKIITVVNGKYRNEGFYRTSTFDEFYIDGYKIDGINKVENMGYNQAQNINFLVTLENGKVTAPDGTVTTREFERTREWTAGFNTPRIRFDDVYMITGGASGVNKKGETYTQEIILPLEVAQSCRWIKSGSIEIIIDEKPAITLDYGDGTCDAVATVSVGEETKTIKLHR